MIVRVKMKAYINGAEIAYDLYGDRGSRVVLLHGWGASRKLMQPAAEALQAEHRVMTLDFPGHGDSGRPPEPWGIPEFSECLIALLKEKDFLPCSVIAHSFGCRVAAWIAAEHPGIFEKMVLTGAAGIRPPQSEEAKARTARYQKARNAAEKLRRIPGMNALADKAEEKLRKKYGSADYNALDEEMRKTFVKVVSLDLRDRYPDIHAPVLLIFGDRDTETPVWMGREMEKLIPDAGLVILENGSHFAYLEQAARFHTICLQFLSEVET